MTLLEKAFLEVPKKAFFYDLYWPIKSAQKEVKARGMFNFNFLHLLMIITGKNLTDCNP